VSEAPLRQRVLSAARRTAGPRLKAAARRVGGVPLVAYERRGLTPELSVVMPVYNVAEYLPQALDSALTQTLHNLELIAVDDGSTDGCLEILREYERKDPRVRVFTQKNSGQGEARNLGVKHARAEFLTFMDSDDTVPPRAFRYLVDNLRQSGSDLAVGSVRRMRHNEFIRTVWARTVHAQDRIGTTLEETPAAMQDIIACNRMFRTEFWREKVGGFRGHIAYEDHVPMLTAYVRAEKFDILSGVTYNWRIRENFTSTGQQKASLENLLDRIAVKEEAYELLQAEASDFVYDTWVGRTLEVDFPTFITHALTAPESYRNILSATYKTYLERANDRALDMVTVRQKVRAVLAADGRWDDLAEADRYFTDLGFLPRTHVVDGRVVADVPDDLPFLQGIPEHLLRLSPLESHFEGVVNHVEWHDDKVTVDGWAVIRGLGISGRSADISVQLVADDGTRIELPVTTEPDVAANIWGFPRYSPYDGAAFTATVDLDVLPRQGRLWFEATTSYDGASASGPFLTRTHHSATVRTNGIRRDVAGQPGWIRAVWDNARGLTLEMEPVAITASELTVNDGQIAGRIHAPGDERVVAVRIDAFDAPAIRLSTTPTADGDLRFSGPLPQATDETWTYTVQAQTRDGWQTPLMVEPDQTARGPRWRHRVDVGAMLDLSATTLDVLDVRLDGETLVVDVHAPALTEAEVRAIVVGNPRQQLALTEATSGGAGDWSLRYSLTATTITGTTMPVPSGRYLMTLTLPRGQVTALAGAALAGACPVRDYGALTNLRVTQTPAGLCQIHLDPALPPEALGNAGMQRLRDEYAVAEVEAVEAVVLGCYRGEFATDSQLALDRALATHAPQLLRYWGVADTSVEVPEGSIALLIDSPEWYAALASATYLCNNIDYGPWFQQRPHQRYLQTFHGYPFKSMGIEFWRSKGFSDEQVDNAVARANREWDVILVPSEECVAYYREQYRFEGEVLVAGYPRCDALVNADAAAVRREVLDRLGVDHDQKVVLYAPTYRDNLTTRTYAAQRFDELDLAELTARLGSGYTLLLRGHNNNQREEDRVTGRAQVVDVTDYPDINELTLAADVAVLDYSSLRFDWAITGKPMVFFVPDQEQYFALRRPLFPYEGTAPGPWATTTDEVIAALADLPALQARYAGDIAAFNERFNGLHDGHATDRVLREFFGIDTAKS